MDSLKLLAHPIRLRIVHAMGGGRLLTTAQLCARVPEASKATVYRHIDLLVSGGVLEVAEEHRVRGAVERHYRLRQDRAVIGAEAVRALSPDDHRQAFATAMTALLAEHFLRLNPGATILVNAICGRAAAEAIERAGGKAIRTRVGHSFIKAKMREHNAVFAGEHSGHYYFKDKQALFEAVFERVTRDWGRATGCSSERGAPASDA